MAVLFSLSAIIAMTWYEWKLRPLQKYELAGIRLKLLLTTAQYSDICQPRNPLQNGRFENSGTSLYYAFLNRPLTRVGIAFGFPAELEGGSVRHLGAIGLAKWLLQLL